MIDQWQRVLAEHSAAAAWWAVTRAGLDDLAAVESMAKMESNRVGFIPRGALRAYVVEGWCRVARLPTGDVVGYSLGRPSLRYARWCRPVTQLVTLPEYRRRGVARALVGATAVLAVADGRHCLQAWSRADLAANHLWDALGFTMIAERTPESARRRPSLLWRLPLTATAVPVIADLPPVGGYRAARTLVKGLFADWKTRRA